MSILEVTIKNNETGEVKHINTDAIIGCFMNTVTISDKEEAEVKSGTFSLGKMNAIMEAGFIKLLDEKKMKLLEDPKTMIAYMLYGVKEEEIETEE